MDTMQIARILVPTDLSEPAHHASRIAQGTSCRRHVEPRQDVDHFLGDGSWHRGGQPPAATGNANVIQAHSTDRALVRIAAILLPFLRRRHLVAAGRPYDLRRV